jgi:hypothetical protein
MSTEIARESKHLIKREHTHQLAAVGTAAEEQVNMMASRHCHLTYMEWACLIGQRCLTSRSA